MNHQNWLNKLFIVLLCHIFFASAAQDVSDSLKKVIHSSSSYQSKINAYLAFGEKYALKNFEETLRLEGEGILLAQINNDNPAIGNIKRYIGIAYYFKGSFNLAAKHYYESINLLENTNQKRSLALTYNELAKLYRKTNSLDRASLNYEKALSIFTQIKDSSGISMIENESGVVYEYKKDYKEAIKRYTTSLSISQALKDHMGISYALSNLAGVYILQKKYIEAEKILKQSLELRKHLNDSLALGLIYSDLAANYYAQKNYLKAVAYIDSSNNIAQTMNYPELQENNFKILSVVSKEKGDYKLAYNFLQKQTALHEALYDKEKIRQIEELNTRYETLNKEKIIQQQKFAINRRNYLIIGGAGFLILATLAGFSYYKRNQLQQKTMHQQAILQQQDISTKAILQAEENERHRIAKDLHDGVGQMMSAAKMNLSAMEPDLNFVDEKQLSSYKNVMTLLDASCKEVRTVSHNMMANVLLKHNLAEALHAFTKQLHHPGLTIQLHIQGLEFKLHNNVETVLYRIIQESVNNVIKHSAATTLDISVIKDADGLSATIEDNGIGFSTEPENFSDGIGIKNIKSRVQYLKGTVEFISSAGAGTLVALHIPAEHL